MSGIRSQLKYLGDAAFILIGSFAAAYTVFFQGQYQWALGTYKFSPLSTMATIVLFCLMALRTRSGIGTTVGAALSIWALQTAVNGPSPILFKSLAGYCSAALIFILFGRMNMHKIYWLAVAQLGVIVDFVVYYGLRNTYPTLFLNSMWSLVTMALIWGIIVLLKKESVLNVHSS